MKLIATVLILGTAIGIAFSNQEGYHKVASTLVLILISFVVLFILFGAIQMLGTTYPSEIYEIEG